MSHTQNEEFIETFNLDPSSRRIGWNVIMLILTTPCNIVERGSAITGRLEIFGDFNRSTHLVELSLCDVCVKSTDSTAQFFSFRVPEECDQGWRLLSAKLLSNASYCMHDGSTCTLSTDSRYVQISLPDTSSPFSLQDRCLESGFICPPHRLRVPSIVHFVFDVKGPPPRCPYFLYLAVRSALAMLAPDVVLIHYHYEPRGRWWRRLAALPRVRTVFAALPTAIFGRPVGFYAHHSDLIRLHALARFGGVYLDSDLLVLAGLAARIAAVPPCGALLGAQPFGWAGNGVIAAAPGAGLVARWLQTYETFSDDRRGFWGAMVPTMLAWAYPEQARPPPPCPPTPARVSSGTPSSQSPGWASQPSRAHGTSERRRREQRAPGAGDRSRA